MSHKVVMPKTDSIEKWNSIREFLVTLGNGSSRFGGREGDVDHWLNGDDWCYYDRWNVVDSDQPDSAEQISNTVFVFKNKEHAVEFALRFL
jgi:hypothetical protein